MTDTPAYPKNGLIGAEVLHCDQTGINIKSRREWIYSLSTGLYTYYYPHRRRGKEAMDAMGVIAWSGGVLIYDHWKA
ncbi:MAG: transposase [Treponema sp.]|nr:transposase [Treponema sp.]